jgi:hypothetical protein
MMNLTSETSSKVFARALMSIGISKLCARDWFSEDTRNQYSFLEQRFDAQPTQTIILAEVSQPESICTILTSASPLA